MLKMYFKQNSWDEQQIKNNNMMSTSIMGDDTVRFIWTFPRVQTNDPKIFHEVNKSFG